MKRIIKNALMIAIFATSFTSFGQDVTIENGGQFKVTNLETIETVIDVNDDQSSFLTKAGLLGKKFRVLNLDKKLNLKSKFEIEIPKVQGKKVKYIGAYKSGKNIYFMTRYLNKKTNTYSLFASELNSNSGKFNRHLEVLTVTDDKFKSLRNPFSIVRSIDSTKILVAIVYPTKQKENVRYGFKVFNNDLTEIWSKDIEFNERDKDFRIQDFEIDSKGNIHMVARMKMSREDKKDKGAKSRYYINVYSYFHESGELKQYEIGFTNEIIRTIDLDVNKNDELIGMGFYSDKNFQLVDNYKGFFFLRIDPNTKEVVASKKTEFSKELIEQLAGKRKAKKGKFPPYIVRQSVPLDNGGYAVIAEHYLYTQTEDSKGNTRESWLFGNVVVMYLNKDGKMTTASVLKKKQYCTAVNGNASFLQMLGIGLTPGVNELAYYGISVMRNKDNIYLLYNENPKNEARLKEGKNPKSVRQRTSVTMLMTFTPDGKINGDVLFKSKDKANDIKMPLMPRSYQQYSENSTIIFGRKGKKMRATRITIK